MVFSSKIRTFIPFAAATALASAVGGAMTASSVGTWYVTLNKPAWTPPSPVFGPVWTLLYALMAIAAWRVYGQAGGWREARGPLSLWGFQLALNALWSACFFALRNPGLAGAEIVLLMAFVFATTASFWRRDRTAGILMVPYCLWGSYATALNLAIWRMN